MSPIFHQLLAALSLIVVSASESAAIRTQFPTLASWLAVAAVLMAGGTKLSAVLEPFRRKKPDLFPPPDHTEQVTPHQRPPMRAPTGTEEKE